MHNQVHTPTSLTHIDPTPSFSIHIFHKGPLFKLSLNMLSCTVSSWYYSYPNSSSSVFFSPSCNSYLSSILRMSWSPPETLPDNYHHHHHHPPPKPTPKSNLSEVPFGTGAEPVIEDVNPLVAIYTMRPCFGMKLCSCCLVKKLWENSCCAWGVTFSSDYHEYMMTIYHKTR